MTRAQHRRSQGLQRIAFHSAIWDTSTDWKEKRVAVIGSDSSSLQMVPKKIPPGRYCLDGLKTFVLDVFCHLCWDTKIHPVGINDRRRHRLWFWHHRLLYRLRCLIQNALVSSPHIRIWPSDSPPAQKSNITTMWSKVTGLNGRVMQEEWVEVSCWNNRIATVDAPTSVPTQYLNIYISVASPNFPNYFTIGNPTGNWGQGSICASVRPPVFVVSSFPPYFSSTKSKPNTPFKPAYW